MNQIVNFYKKINGYYFGFITLIIGLGGSILAMVLYIMEDPRFSIFNNFISDLSIGPNGSNIIFILFNLGMAIIVQPFFFYLSEWSTFSVFSFMAIIAMCLSIQKSQ